MVNQEFSFETFEHLKQENSFPNKNLNKGNIGIKKINVIMKESYT